MTWQFSVRVRNARLDAIWTSKGFIPESELTFTTGELNNDTEHTTWDEWRDDTGEIVKRNVHVRLKKGVEMTAEIGNLG